jgi:hypothetical protein
LRLVLSGFRKVRTAGCDQTPVGKETAKTPSTARGPLAARICVDCID